MRQPHVRHPAFSLPAACPPVCGRNPRTENFRRILLSQIAQSDYIPATCNLHRRGGHYTMRTLTIIAIAAMSFGFASCAKKTPPPAPVDGKTVHHHHGYKK